MTLEDELPPRSQPKDREWMGSGAAERGGQPMIVIHTLGAALIDLGDTRLTPTSSRKFALLLHLAARSGHRVSRAVLRDLIFGDQDDTHALHSLREAVYQLRYMGAPIESIGDMLELPATAVQNDVDEFVNAEQLSATQIAAAHGGFLPAYAPSLSEAFTEWLEGYRAESTFAVCKALNRAAEGARSVCDWLMTEHAARACLALSPWNAAATRCLAQALAAGGARVEAMQLLDKYMAEMGPGSADLKVSAELLRWRIGERLSNTYQPDHLRFVGREEEIRVLKNRLVLARSGIPQCIVLTGESGIGTTRIASEISAIAVFGGWVVQRFISQSQDVQRPMSAFTDLAPKLVDLPGAGGSDPESIASIARLSNRIGATFDIAAATEMSDVRNAAFVHTICDVIGALTIEAPLMLVLEDAHWLDAASWGLVARLASSSSSGRLAILLTSRQDAPVPVSMMSHAHLLQLVIGPLSPAATGTIIDAHLPKRFCADPAAVAWVHRIGAGNPLHLQYLIDHIKTTGEHSSIPLPLAALIDQRLTGLSPIATEVLLLISLLGKHATYDRLTQALQVPWAEALSAVRELESAHMIAEDDGRIEPIHTLIAEGLERRNPPITAKLARQRVAIILLAESEGSQNAALLWAAADLCVASSMTSEAIKALRACAGHSLTLGRAREAAQSLLRAAGLLPQAERKSLVSEAVRIAAGSELDLTIQAIQLLGRRPEAEHHDDFELASLQAELSESKQGDDSYLRLLDCIASTSARIDHRLGAALSLLMYCDHSHDMALAHKVFAVVQMIADSGTEHDRLLVLKSQLVFHTCVGDSSTAATIARSLLVAAADARPDVAADLQRKAAIGFWRSGHTSEALAAFRDSYATARECGLLRLQFHLALMLASEYSDIANPDESQLWIDRAQEVASDLPNLMSSFFYFSVRGDLALASGDTDELRRLNAVSTAFGTQNERARRRTAALSLLVRHLDSHAPSTEDVVEAMTSHHRPASELGDSSDFEVAVLAAILTERDERATAIGRIGRYLDHYRRDKSPILAALRIAMGRLGALRHESAD